MRIRLIAFGEDSAEVATSFGNIGNYRLRKQDLDQSIDAHRKAMGIRQKVFGAGSPQIVESYRGLGNAYREKQEYEEALRYFRMALSNKTAQLGEGHEDLARYHDDIARVYRMSGDEENAMKHEGIAKALARQAAAATGAAVSGLQTTTPADAFATSGQLLVVTTPDADAVDGRLQRYERDGEGGAWRPVGEAVAIVVGRNGLAWGSGLLAAPDEAPKKKEGDGRSPEGAFALGTSFGQAGAALPGARLPYLSLDADTECVDDTASIQHQDQIGSAYS